MPNTHGNSDVKLPQESASVSTYSSPRNSKTSVTKGRFKAPTRTASPALSLNNETKKVSEAKEELRRLKVVDYHRKHNDLQTLSMLKEIWKEAGHRALHELHAVISVEPKPSKTELLSYLHIPPEQMTCECDEF